MWRRLSGSLWFIPTLIVFGAIALAMVMVELSSLVSIDAMMRFPRLFGAGADGARSMLATIAGSMATVAGVSFSVTVVAVAQASSQYTPRILRNFMRDRANQSVLGVLMGAFAYCIVVLRTIRGGENEFVPSIAVLGGVALAIGAIGVFVFFIHHITETLEAGSILSRIANETTRALAHRAEELRRHGARRASPERVVAPQKSHVQQHETWPTQNGAGEWSGIAADRTGYLQAIDIERMVAYANEQQARVRVETDIGEFVIEGERWLSVQGAAPSEGDRTSLNRMLSVSSYRTVSQDPAFGVRQIVDIAVKALSPGINDTTTAVSCIDYLEVILAAFLRVDEEGGEGVDTSEGVLIRRHQSITLLSEAMNEIRQSAPGNVRVLLRLLGAIEFLHTRTTATCSRQALRHHADLIARTARRAVSDEDRALVLERHRALTRTLTEN